MADTADTADIMANTANILARYRREVDTSSAEAGQNSAAAHRENTATGEVETGVAVIGAAGGIIDSPVTDSSSAGDLVIRTTGLGTPLGAGAFLTRLPTAIIPMGIILRIGTIMVITLAPYQEGNSLGPDPSDSRGNFAIELRFPSKFAVGRSPSEAQKKVALSNRPRARAFRSRCQKAT